MCENTKKNCEKKKERRCQEHHIQNIQSLKAFEIYFKISPTTPTKTALLQKKNQNRRWWHSEKRFDCEGSHSPETESEREEDHYQ
jgi:hypothetical protein